MFPQPPAPTDGAEAARGPREDTESRASARLGVGARYARRRRQAALGGDDARCATAWACAVRGGAGWRRRHAKGHVRVPRGRPGPRCEPSHRASGDGDGNERGKFLGRGRGAGSARRAARERGEGSTVSAVVYWAVWTAQ